jgi:hypothetical protein
MIVAGGSGDSHQTDPLLYPRSISRSWALHPRDEGAGNPHCGGTLAAKNVTIAWNDPMSHFQASY